MLIYLVRHGEAVNQMEDTARPLSDKGGRDIRSMGELLARHFRMVPGYIFHSPRLRAVQTASILGDVLPGAPAPLEAEGLGPGDDPATWAERLETVDRDTMLVGHLPHISRLASLLLLWDPGREFLNFTPGTVACLEKTSGWRVKWMISPDILKSP